MEDPCGVAPKDPRKDAESVRETGGTDAEISSNTLREEVQKKTRNYSERPVRSRILSLANMFDNLVMIYKSDRIRLDNQATAQIEKHIQVLIAEDEFTELATDAMRIFQKTKRNLG